MRLKTIAETLKSLLPTKQPVILWGPPGVGKSQIIAQTAVAMGVDLIDVRAVLLDPVDLRGLPHVESGQAHWASPAFLPHDHAEIIEGEVVESSTGLTAPAKRGAGKGGILLLDEIDKAPPLVQNACLQLTLDRKIGEYTLPDNWYVMAAANRIEDRAGGHKMGTALSSRFLHLDVTVDNKDWIEWALSAGIHGSIVGYIRWRPDALHPWGKKGTNQRDLSNAGDRTFPSPRTWEFVSRVVDHVPASSVREVVAGCVGPAASAEYCNFLEVYRALPDPDAMLNNPDTCDVPSEVNVIWALCGYVAERARNADVKLQGNITRLLKRFPKEFGLRGVQDCVIANRGMATEPNLVQWFQNDPKLCAAVLGGTA